MIQAAGILFLTDDDKVLLLRRTGKDHAGEWAFPGGTLEDGETHEQAARRELLEETGMEYTADLLPWTRRCAEDVCFTTYLVHSEAFEPTLNPEHDAWQWVDRSFAIDAPRVHPGVSIALRRFGMDELDIAKAIVAGDLVSPQRYGNLLLVALRITGTGAAYRQSLKEFVWRDPSIYMNPEFLERCNGLPVVFEHPSGNMLDTKEFKNRIVGTIFVPYLKPPDEVWGIAKILDAGAAKLLETENMSTSPGVAFLNIAPGVKYVTDSKTILLENEPSLLDHLAILIETEDSSGAGVWDKGGPLAGVDSIDARADAQAVADPLDTILHTLQVQEACRRANRLATSP